MIATRRYDGLEYLKVVGLPIPRVQTVLSTEDVHLLQLYSAPHGWTIRTCHVDGMDEFRLFYSNYTDHHQVKKILFERFRSHAEREFYIVYESWKFLLSLNIVYVNDVVVEGKYGSQKALSIGSEGSDFSLTIPMGLTSNITRRYGSIDEDTLFWVRRINYMLRRIEWDDFYTEVAVTQERKVLFYELRRVAV